MRAPLEVKIEVWSEQPLHRCPHPCKHCNHNARRQSLYLGSFYTWDEVFAVMPNGRRMFVRRAYYCRFHRRRIVQVRFNIRRAL